MDELIAILDARGEFTGKTEMKSHAHRMGLFHATVHVWFYTKTGAVLIQQRGTHKDTYPLLWDVSVAGHIGVGEGIAISALREIAEEIGLAIKKEQLYKIGVFKSIQNHSKDLIDCEFHHTFICKLPVPLKELKKQEDEVAALELISLDVFEKEVSKNKKPYKYVPHQLAYYQKVITCIKEQL